MLDDLVTIAKFETASEAHLARVTLDAEGIEAVVEGEDTAVALPYGSMTFVSVDLLVREGDAPRAVAILGKIPAAAENLVDWRE